MKCATIGCEKAATLKCPTCLKMSLPDTYFCTQECFKTYWPIHKTFHTPASKDKLPEKFHGFTFTGSIRPGTVSAMRAVPEHIERTEYAVTGIPEKERRERRQAVVEVKTKEQIEKMRKVCKLGREVLDIAGKAVRVGITTDEIDRIVHEACIERNSYPSPLNYNKFPKSCCTSVNEVICHGIPDSRPLEDGDIVNIDISVFYDGYHSDLNETFFVGNVDEASKHLVNTTRECLQKAIEMVRPGAFYKEIGNVIGKHAHENGLSVVRSYVGHGIGELFHAAPSIPHYPKNKAVGTMKVGHVFTIEPMINQGTWHDVLWPDNWTAVTRDGKKSAQFEHTLLVTETGVEVLTA
eukprot:TRINITY_DN5195_c0_g2_i2.p1 TRINITY_DN5195_c0_g2~~TRINITY_DN5195_c0_g2_i2.p1  ORF type:complete len:358 (-),score=58.00 TRINITY_DN5195_c0_g2_i2:118-1170(-)